MRGCASLSSSWNSISGLLLPHLEKKKTSMLKKTPHIFRCCFAPYTILQLQKWLNEKPPSTTAHLVKQWFTRLHFQSTLQQIFLSSGNLTQMNWSYPLLSFVNYGTLSMLDTRMVPSECQIWRKQNLKEEVWWSGQFVPLEEAEIVSWVSQ